MHPGYFDQLAEDQGEPETHVVPDTDIETPADQTLADDRATRLDRP